MEQSAFINSLLQLEVSWYWCKNAECGNETAWIQILPLLLELCVTWGKSVTFSEYVCSPVWVGSGTWYTKITLVAKSWAFRNLFQWQIPKCHFLRCPWGYKIGSWQCTALWFPHLMRRISNLDNSMGKCC